jgi:uncharacterized membrane protein (DUF485 family)
MDEKKKKLKKMATWTIAIFATVFAVTFAVLWLVNYPLSTSGMDAIGKVFATGWPILVADLVLCVLVYAGYSFFTNKK